jgi:hypothetical protein
VGHCDTIDSVTHFGLLAVVGMINDQFNYEMHYNNEIA